jgi:hypothetical protein
MAENFLGGLLGGRGGGINTALSPEVPVSNAPMYSPAMMQQGQNLAFSQNYNAPMQNLQQQLGSQAARFGGASSPMGLALRQNTETLGRGQAQAAQTQQAEEFARGNAQQALAQNQLAVQSRTGFNQARVGMADAEARNRAAILGILPPLFSMGV